MDVEKTYSLGPYRVVLGWTDTEQEYYGRIEPSLIEEGKPYAYHLIIGHRDWAAMLAFTQEEVTRITGTDFLEIPESDIRELVDAPHTRLVDSSEIERLPMLDTDYAQNPIYGNQRSSSEQHLSFEEFLAFIDDGQDSDLFSDAAAYDDLVQMVADCYSELEACVSCLKSFLLMEGQEHTDDSEARRESLCQSAISFTAGQLVQTNEALFRSFPLERIGEIAHASTEDMTASVNQIYTPEELARINRVTVSLCGSKLTDFIKAVERGYDPVTGLPLECPNPESFSWAATIQEGEETLYQQSVLSEEQASRAVAIQRTDPRYREEEDWAFLEAMREKMAAYIEVVRDTSLTQE
ncbi:MAG: hypothetical protein AAF329_12750 [Cyanobacteria bacterium P01_A01_bin.17]